MKHRDPDLLNRLHEMQQSPYYATACQTLIRAEMLIVELERDLLRQSERATELGNVIKSVANADIRTWEDGYRTTDEFFLWAQNLCRAVAATIPKLKE